MVILNDIGLTLEIAGFIIFLFVPIQESFNLSLNGGNKPRIRKFIENNPKVERLLRGLGIPLIIAGLIMQYGFLN